MENLLDSGMKWLSEQLAEHASKEVTYRRGATELTVLATIGTTVFRRTDDYGIEQRYESRDFLIQSTLLVEGNVLFEPQGGDQIVETIAGQQHTFEVMALGGEPVFRWSDEFGHSLRIHTKQIT